MKNKNAAIELSMTTIVVVVLSLSLLILGFVLVRSIMCGAIGLTGDINDKVKKEVQTLFDTTNGEIVCVGSGDAVKIAPGINNIYCAFDSKTGATYDIRVKEIKPVSSSISKNINFDSWIKIGEQSIDVTPSDKAPQKVSTLEIPADSPEGVIRVILEVKRQGTASAASTSTQTLDYEISRTGVIRAALC